MQLQSVLMPDNRFENDMTAMYYHSCGNRVDFDGYFNLFYIEKRKVYTCIDNLYLDINLKGYEKLIVVHNKEDILEVGLDSKENKNYIIELPYDDYNEGVFSFSLIEADSEERSVRGFYITKTTPANKAKIAVEICTYKREEYIARNVAKLKEDILDNDGLDVFGNVDIFIVDNAKTLKNNEECATVLDDDRVTVIENKNAGGAGGFTRGIIEINEQKRKKGYTHVLLMDDDAVIEPDALVRIYGMLTMLKAEWKNMTIGGMLLAEDIPNYLCAAGEEWINGDVSGLDAAVDLSSYDNNTSGKLLNPYVGKRQYSGWWLCCYSLNAARLDNLPLPYFIHGDDVEYGIRNYKHGIVFLNGVNVWHRRSVFTFSGSNLYYDMRNALITEALHSNSSIAKTVKLCFEKITGMLIKDNYADAKLKNQGILDFLKGPEFIMDINPEAFHKEVSMASSKMVTIDELDEHNLGRNNKKVIREIQNVLARFEEDKQVNIARESLGLKTMLTYNGNILPTKRNSVSVILPADSIKNYYRKKKVVVVDPISKKVLIVNRSTKSMLGELTEYIKTSVSIIKRYKGVRKQYRSRFREMTNVNFWKKYLDI